MIWSWDVYKAIISVVIVICGCVLVYFGKASLEQVATWTGAMVVALGLEGKKDA